MIVRTLRKVARRRSPDEPAVQAWEAAAREELGRMYALPAATVAAIEELREAPILRSLPATIRSFSLDLVTAGLAAAAAIWASTPRTRGGRLTATALTGLLAAGLTGGWVRRASKINDHRNLRTIARSIADTLGVRYVVFGHSHEPDVHRLAGDTERWYFNVGTWVPNLQEGQFVYMHVVRDGESAAQLMRWNRKWQRPEAMDPARFSRGARTARG
jgi:hypothetical protein